MVSIRTCVFDKQHARTSSGKDWKETEVSAPRHCEIPEMTDENVVRLAQHGDIVAFERIYRLHSRKVYNFCLRMLDDRTDSIESRG
jgi:hypothetical protein